MYLRTLAILPLMIFYLLFGSTLSYAVSEEEKTFLNMYFTEDELQVVSATRSLKSIARVAENMEVVTKADIELMNAHTVAEALYNVTGVEMLNFVGPGSQGLAQIHDSDYTRVAALFDGVPLQSSGNGVALGILPVQMIEKIEIIKGPASSTWGSSFGGVINIITKSVRPGDHIGGSLYSSGGEHNTSDLRAETYGRKGNVGVYLFGGTLNSEGLVNRHEFWHDNLFSKITIDTGEKSKIDLSFMYHKSDARQVDYLVWGTDAYDAYILEHIYGRAAFSAGLSPEVDLDISAWMFRQHDVVYENTVSSDQRLWDGFSNFNKYGLSGSVTWRTGAHTVVAGTDLLNGRLELSTLPDDKMTQRKYGLFINDTIKINSVSITPGLRYDNTNIGGDIISPSLGLTWIATKDLLVRLLVARGFHDPLLWYYFDSPTVGFVGNPGIKPEKIWSYQAGAETNVADIFKLKLTLFLHDIDNIITDKDLGGPTTVENGGRAKTIGGELELASNNYKGFTLKSGINYERRKLLDFSDVRSFDTSNLYGFNATLAYNGEKGLKAILKGHYMWWNEPAFWEAKYNGFVVDFNAAKEIFRSKSTTLEAFFTAHNIFNAFSYSDILSKNPRRWSEAGLRYRF